MTDGKVIVLRRFDPGAVTTVLCDADGNLFPSEEPAFDASVEVTNRYLARFGVSIECTAEGLREQTTGKNFRTTAVDLAVKAGVPIDESLAQRHPNAVIATRADVIAGRALTADELEEWVSRERDHVTSYLGSVLHPDDRVLKPLQALGSQFGLAAVSSSAAMRLDACFAATGLDRLIPAALRFSAEDSLPVPTSKPDPAVYRLSGQVLGIGPAEVVAVEDSVPGVLSAVAAGFVTIGNVMFVPPSEKRARATDLARAGASAISNSWWAIADLLQGTQDSVGQVFTAAGAHR
jgi:beta-phosphoglucomutase-like phosphatase (HAD superfamily)